MAVTVIIVEGDNGFDFKESTSLIIFVLIEVCEEIIKVTNHSDVKRIKVLIDVDISELKASEGDVFAVFGKTCIISLIHFQEGHFELFFVN